jgi:hypothetical protein
MDLSATQSVMINAISFASWLFMRLRLPRIPISRY